MCNTIVVNLFGVPGAGKSTGAAYIFYRLKINGINAELVTEFAKDKVWEHNDKALSNQSYVFGKQAYRLARCADNVDVIVTDSPLPLSILYNNDKRLTENFNKSVMDVFNTYNNINFLVMRTKPYNPAGRIQTEEESDKLKEPIIELLADRNIQYEVICGDTSGYNIVVENIIKKIKNNSEKVLTNK